MRRRLRAPSIAILAASALLTLGWSAPASAGGGEGFGTDEEQELVGHRYVGYVRDKSGDGIADAKVTVDLKVGTVVMRTDQEGHFVIPGFGTNVDPEDVKFSCSKDGLKQLSLSKQMTSDAPTAPVEVNCILGPP